MAAPEPQVMDSVLADLDVMVDEEIAPQQFLMAEDPEHGAALYTSLGEGSKPVSSDSLFSQLFCITFGIGDLAGEVMIGEETTFCCINSKAFCGFGGEGGCPAANCSCTMLQPYRVPSVCPELRPVKSDAPIA
ncbi:unnamed protein product [Symbiodinium natans]|uniref:Uncharacterized protein n=1 Tax=Symbiodinium natans TaxID=878477 RepID=A0A812PGJ1_9DINO|nr:unnamed protein product [Symbiodinium natans]